MFLAVDVSQEFLNITIASAPLSGSRRRGAALLARFVDQIKVGSKPSIGIVGAGRKVLNSGILMLDPRWVGQPLYLKASEDRSTKMNKEF